MGQERYLPTPTYGCGANLFVEIQYGRNNQQRVQLDGHLIE